MLGRDETREFLRGKIMVPYQEKWMGCVDTAKKVHGWTDITITHFYNLAVWGERILLSVRFGNWNNNAVTAANAANWATYWRHDIQGYNHALRTVTGVDVNAPITNVGAASTLYQQPSFHIQNRRPRAA